LVWTWAQIITLPPFWQSVPQTFKHPFAVFPPIHRFFLPERTAAEL
jgi:hypothetical protein